jgi:hypothetical protein
LRKIKFGKIDLIKILSMINCFGLDKILAYAANQAVNQI